MESLYFSWQFPQQGAILHIISLQNFADGFSKSTEILIQCKTLPDLVGELSRFSSQGIVKSDVYFGIQKTLPEIFEKLVKFPLSGKLMKCCNFFFSCHQAIMLYVRSRNGKFGHREILVLGSKGNPVAFPYFISVILVHVNEQLSFISNSEVDFPCFRWTFESEISSIQKPEKAQIFPVQCQRCASPVPIKSMAESTSGTEGYSPGA